MRLDTPAQRLKWARLRHGKYDTPTDAARAFGWPVSTYLGHENGDRNPSRAAAKRYAKAYHVRWEWLLENEGTPDVEPSAESAPGHGHLSILIQAYTITVDQLGLSAADWNEIEAGGEMPPALVLALHDLTKLPLSYIRHGLADELSAEEAKKLLSVAVRARETGGRARRPALKRGQNR